METTMHTITNTSPSPFKLFWGQVGRALFQPTRFFREDLPHFNWSEAAAFGFGNAWMASLGAFLISTINSLLVSQMFDRWVQRMLSSEDTFRLFGTTGKSFLMDSGMLVITPFLLLLQAFFGAGVLYVFSRLLIEDSETAPEPVSYSGVMRLQCASYVSYWFLLVPFIGGFLSFVVQMIFLITGVRERFEVSTRRAMAVVLMPYILLFILGLLLTLLVIIGISQIPFQDLMDIDPAGFGLPKAG